MGNYESKYANAVNGLDKNSDPRNQPENTYRFALNAVNNTNNQLEPYLSNENSNELDYNLNTLNSNLDIIGKIYIGDNQTVLFVASIEADYSGIILDDNGIYKIIIPFTNKLNLDSRHKVYGTFRKIRGAEKVIYFTDNYNKPRSINLNNIGDYFINNVLIPEKLTLINDYQIPNITSRVLNGNGIIHSGSYNFAIQYLTEDLNGTNWITTSNPVNVYSANISSNYHKIAGSYSKDRMDSTYDKLFTEPACNKTIEINIIHSELNTKTFAYFRIAVIIARNNTGIVTEVLASNEYPIGVSTIIYTGNNEGYYKIAKEEIFPDKVDIDTVKHITQLDSRLILSNGKGKQIDWCSFQKSASAIRTDYLTEDVPAFDNIISENPKSTTDISMGFMGGEVYAFGIVYEFNDGTLSPVYHIPGKSNTSSSNMEFYEVVDNKYEPRLTKSGDDYWGNDYDNNPLVGNKIRHHKFPDRNKVKLVVKDNTIKGETLYRHTLNVYTDTPISTAFPLTIILFYNTVYATLITVSSTEYTNHFTFILPFFNLPICELTSLTIKDVNDNVIPVTSPSTIVTEYLINPTLQSKIRLLKIRFVNINYPSSDIIGHYIVVGERDASNRLIIDKGIVQSLSIDSASPEEINRFVANLYFNNSGTYLNKIRTIFYAKSPKILFEKNALNPESITIEGIYRHNLISYENIYQQNAFPGTSSKGLFLGLIPDDTDGMDWNLYSKFITYDYKQYDDLNYVSPDYLGTRNLEIDKSVYLRQAEKISNFYNGYGLVNMELDAQTAVLKASTGSLPWSSKIDNANDLFYVSFNSGNNDIHPVLENITYYKTHANIITGSQCTIKEGDIYINHFPLSHSTYYKSTQPRRIGEAITNIVTMLVLTIGAVLTTIFTAGVGSTSIILVLALGAEVLSGLIGLGAIVLAELIKDIDAGELSNYVKNKDYEHNTNIDSIPKDDSLKYVAEHIENVFVESDLNIGLRLKIQNNVTSYYDNIGNQGLKDYYRAKYLVNDETRVDDNKSLLTLIPTGNTEVYEYNKDYSRHNREKVFFPIPLTYKCTSNSLETWQNRVLWSQRDFEESRTDVYKVFLPNDYRDMPTEYGEITNIETLNNILFIFTERMLFKIPPNIQQQINSEFVTFIGTGAFLSLDPQKLVDDEIGQCGTTFKDSMIKYNSSIVFVDDQALKIYIISSDGLKCLSDIGMTKWFKDNLKFQALSIKNNAGLEQSKDLLHLRSGYGFQVVADISTNRIIFTKKDYTLDNSNNDYEYHDNEWSFTGDPYPLEQADYTNNSFTISFSLNTMKWTSFHSYLPYFMYRTNEGFKSIIKSGIGQMYNSSIYKHGVANSYCNFYNHQYDFILDLVIPIMNIQQFMDEFLYINTKATTYDNVNNNFIELRKEFFNQVIFYNSRQCSGKQILNPKTENNLWLSDQVANTSNNLLVSKREGTFNLNEIRDYRINYNVPVFNKNLLDLQSNYYIDKILNTTSIDINKQWTEIENFKDNYLGIRLFYNNTLQNIGFKLYYVNSIKLISNT